MKFFILFFSLISASHGAEIWQTLVGILGQGVSLFETEKTVSWNAINDGFFESPQQYTRIIMTLENQNQDDLLPLMGDVNLFSSPLNSRPLVMHREPFDLQALKNYYGCLNRIAEELFKFTLKNHSVVMDCRAVPLEPSHNQIWFDGKVVLRLSQEKTQMAESQTQGPVYHCFLGFDTPLGYKPVLSLCVYSSILSSYCMNLCQKFNLTPVEYGTNSQSYALRAITFGATQYVFDGPAQRSGNKDSSSYKMSHQYVQSDEALKAYERLNVPAPKSLAQLLKIPVVQPVLDGEDRPLEQGNLQSLNQETRAATTNVHEAAPVRDIRQ